MDAHPERTIDTPGAFLDTMRDNPEWPDGRRDELFDLLDRAFPPANARRGGPTSGLATWAGPMPGRSSG